MSSISSIYEAIKPWLTEFIVLAIAIGLMWYFRFYHWDDKD